MTPDNPRPRDGMRYGIDNGAWGAYKQQSRFDGEAFTRLVDKHGAAADFIVIPDIVAGGMDSLRFSVSWLPYLRGRTLLLPVQDGMDTRAVIEVLHGNPHVGLFLGGSTEWKLRTMYQWGEMAQAMRRHYHVGRVNTARRIRLAAEAGADSFDGTSATRYACTLPLLESSRQQPSLLTPGVFA